ncbi:MAG: DUF5103 domain-containing protein [Bacteroidales bacterium]|nr:DUF5103 domain-containing protein [Bacteroidales bacterium]
MNKWWVALAVAALPVWAWAVEDTSTQVFDMRVKSLQVKYEGDALAPAVVTLGGGDRIVVDFDRLGEERDYLRYSLTHCNADWQPSRLVELEYLDGFNEGTVDDYQFSRATTVHYTHYQLAIPNEHMTMKVSGNYLLKVWDETDPDEILFQARFMVTEGGADISGDVLAITDVDHLDKHQQLSLMVDTERAGVADNYNDLIIVITQDGREDNKQVLLHPLRANRTRAYYEHLPQLIFPAGNEYRRFEDYSTYYPGMGVTEIGFYDPYYNFTLATDMPRSEGRYEYDQTQYGRYTIREYNSSESDIDADYGIVHFTLDYPWRDDVDIFIDSDAFQRRFDPESRMVYNRATGLWHRSALLKQGNYNYQYLAVPRGSMRGSTAEIEGDYYNTRNEYVVYVYHRAPGSRYDRLIGVAPLYSF